MKVHGLKALGMNGFSMKIHKTASLKAAGGTKEQVRVRCLGVSVWSAQSEL